MSTADRTRPAPADQMAGARGAPPAVAVARTPVLIVSTYFPNGLDPHRAVFVSNLARALAADREVEVVAPVPWSPPFGRWRAQRAMPMIERIAGFTVRHPRYFQLPGVYGLTGLGYALGIAPTLWRAGRRERPPVIHAHCAYPDGVGVALVARLLGLRYLVTAHGSDLNVYARRPVLRAQIGWALRGADAVIAVSRGLAGIARELMGPRANRLARIPCAAFDPAVFGGRTLARSVAGGSPTIAEPRAVGQADARQALGLDAGTGRIVLFVGQLVPIKGLDTLAQAWSMLAVADALRAGDRLVLVGEGPSRAAIERALDSTASRVVFTGPLAQPEVARWMRAADLLCLPSLAEGTPNVVIEALACGIPVVASRVGGLPELIDETNGLLAPPSDAPALADALRVALARDWPAETIRAGVAGRTWEAIAARNGRVLDAVALGQPPET